MNDKTTFVYDKMAKKRKRSGEMSREEKTVRWYRVIGWVFFALAVGNFLGLFTHYDSVKEAQGAMTSQIISMGLPTILTIDFKTIFLAAVAAWFGFRTYQKGQALGYAHPKGKCLFALSILCAILTFTPVAGLSLIKPVIASQTIPAAYEEIPAETYALRCFVGSEDSEPSDVDVIWYNDGYDGSAKDVYETYKICGYIRTEETCYARDPVFTFGLLDKDGNVILGPDGQPCALTCDMSGETLLGIGLEEFETDTVDAEDLSAVPVRYCVLSTQRSLLQRDLDSREHSEQ